MRSDEKQFAHPSCVFVSTSRVRGCGLDVDGDKNKKAVGEHAHSDAGNRKPWEIAKVSSKRDPRLAVEEWIVESWSTSLRKQLSIQHQRPATTPREFSCLFVQTGT